MPDFLEAKRSEIRERLDKLAPAVEEYSRLEAAAAALARIDGAGPAAPAAKVSARRGRPRKSAGIATAAPAKAARKGPGRPKGRGGRPKGSGGRAAETLAAVQAQPGITIPELGTKLGIKANYLYRVLPPLEKEGKVTKKGKGWYPSGA